MFDIYWLPMAGFELRTSGIVSNRSTNWATTTALKEIFYTVWNYTYLTLKAKPLTSTFEVWLWKIFSSKSFYLFSSSSFLPLSLLFAHTFSLSLTLSVILTNKSHFLCIFFILYFQQLTWEICNFKSAQWLYSNPGPLVSDANILGTNYAESFYKKLNIPGIFSLTFGLFKQWNLLSDKRD